MASRRQRIWITRAQPGAALTADRVRALGHEALVIPLLAVRNMDDVEAVRREVERHLVPLGHKVYGVINYDHFVLDEVVQDDWAAMVRELVENFYIDVARYTTSAFLRAKLGEALLKRGVAPHIFENSGDARKQLLS